jgi:predicted amidohydrolase
MASTSGVIAAVQAAPVFLNLEASIDKACGLIEEAAIDGAQLVVFPEAFLPAYPVWVWFIPSGHTHPLRELYTVLHANSVTIPGPWMKPISDVAADLGVTVAIGVNERNSEASNASTPS